MRSALSAEKLTAIIIRFRNELDEFRSHGKKQTPCSVFPEREGHVNPSEVTVDDGEALNCAR